MSEQHFGHLNRGYLRGPFGSAEVAEFETNIDLVNSVAQRSPGYVANVDVDAEEAREVFFWPEADLNRVAITISVWTDPHLLNAFVHKTIHGRFLTRRHEWFRPMDGPSYVVWPIKTGHLPDLAEAKAAYDRLASSGPGPEAFDFGWLAARPAS